MSRRRLSEKFPEIINAERYRVIFSLLFFPGKLIGDEVSSADFQPNCDTAHTHRLVYDPFADRMFSKNIRTMHSRDLTVPGYFLWGAIENAVYGDNSYTLQALEETVTTSQANLPRIFQKYEKRREFLFSCTWVPLKKLLER
jgi:hypothetical protein